MKKRILFTLGALVIYRLGTYIPLAGIDPVALYDVFSRQGDGLIGNFDMFSGGAFSRMAIVALGVMPCISAFIIMLFMMAAVPTLQSLKKEGGSGRRKIHQYTRYLTALLAAIQGYGIAVWLERSMSSVGPVVIDPGFPFEIATVITIVGGTMFLTWLGEQITRRGVGDGISLIIFAGIVANLPAALAQTLDLGRTGALSTVPIIGLLVMAVAVIAFIVFMERARRRIVVQYPRRQVGNRMFGGESSHLPLKLNTSGVIPPIFASSLLMLPATFAGFAGGPGSDWMTRIAAYLGRGQPGYDLIYVSLIVFFAFFYRAVAFNTTDTADNLKKYGGFIPGIRPGKNTAAYLDFVLTRLTVIGAIYLSAVCILPEILLSQYAVPYYFGGTSLLFFGGTSLFIVASVTMDTVGRIHAHMLAQRYGGPVKT